MFKIGRNDPCSCGSGKKFKKCHGSISTIERHQETMGRLISEHNVRELQRKKQQGLGRPIISADLEGVRFVAVKNRLIHSAGWKTFHDFLFDYIKNSLGIDWGNAEISKKIEERHPILIWYQHLSHFQSSVQGTQIEIKSSTINGAVAAYLHLAYDLYSLDHNAELQEKFLHRLRNINNFYGARYELFVAASMIRSGFEITLEDEDDRSSTHCEFVATNLETGRKFSVEAKRNHAEKIRVERLLQKALKKSADFDRIIFIDINRPDQFDSSEKNEPLKKSLKIIRRFEAQIKENKNIPKAYVFVTNTPWEHHLQDNNVKCSLMADGFLIDDFKFDLTYPNLREAINSRSRHVEIHNLIKSMKDHSDVPSTFDGEYPEFAFNSGQKRLLIGDKYLVSDADGNSREGVLTTATVNKSKKVAFCAFTFENGTAVISSWPLTGNEIKAWESNPDTFFGKVIKVYPEIKDLLGMCDFMHDAYKHTPKDRLLELMADNHDYFELSKLSQPELASLFSERSAYAAWSLSKNNNIVN